MICLSIWIPRWELTKIWIRLVTAKRDLIYIWYQKGDRELALGIEATAKDMLKALGHRVFP